MAYRVHIGKFLYLRRETENTSMSQVLQRRSGSGRKNGEEEDEKTTENKDCREKKTASIMTCRSSGITTA